MKRIERGWNEVQRGLFWNYLMLEELCTNMCLSKHDTEKLFVMKIKSLKDTYYIMLKVFMVKTISLIITCNLYLTHTESNLGLFGKYSFSTACRIYNSVSINIWKLCNCDIWHDLFILLSYKNQINTENVRLLFVKYQSWIEQWNHLGNRSGN